MTQDLFFRKNQSRWQEFEELLNNIKKHKNANSFSFPGSYRRLCHDLNFAKAKGYDLQLIDRLNNLVMRGHQILYDNKRFSLSSFTLFWIRDFPATVRREFRIVLASLIIFYGTACLLFFSVRRDPAVVYLFVDEGTLSGIESMYNPAADNFLKPRDVTTDADMFGFYIYNNISIGFRTFSGGILAGFGSLFFMVYNSIFLGAIGGHIVNIGYTQPFFSFVIGHGALELNAIVLMAASGLILGWSLVARRRYCLSDALKLAGQRALPLVLGSTAMLIIAATIEAFWSSKPLPFTLKFMAGSVLWILLLVYFLFAGKRYGRK